MTTALSERNPGQDAVRRRFAARLREFLPLEDGVLLSLAKFTRILEIDTANRTATVEPGVRNLAITDAAAPHGFYYPPHPSSQLACSIGGNVAENAGGV